MADQYTPEEIQQIFDSYNDAIRKGVPITEAMAREMADATKGVKNYTNQLNYSFKQLGTSIKHLGTDLANGAKGASVFNNSLEAGADVIANFTSKFGILGTVIGGVIKAGGMYVSAVNKQSDALYKSYQEISRAGTAGKEGMTGIYDSMKKFGYTVDQLGEMGSLLKENSKSFGLFSASALAGSKQFAGIADTIQNSPLRQQLFNMGMSVDDINRGIAGYLVQEGKLGKLRGRDQSELTTGAKSYIREMEILTRLTGQNREELENERERALQIDAFYAGLKDLPTEARKEALKTFNIASSISKDAATEFASNFNGVITGTTDLLMATSGESLKYNAEFFKANGKATDAIQGLGDAAQRSQKTTDDLAKIGVKFGLGSRESTMLTGKAADGFGKSMADVSADVDAAAAGFDKTTNAQSALRESQIKTAQGMNDFVNLGIGPVTRAMQELARVIESLTSMLPGSKATMGYGRGGTGTMGKSVASMATGAATGAAIGSVVPVVGTGIGAAVGAAAGYLGYEFGGGGGLTGKSTSGLEPDFNEKLQRAAAEYQQLTGKSIEIVSAKRTAEEQAKLYADFQAGRSKFPAAPPGQSRHESGRAVDVPLATANALDQMGLLQKHGLSRPVAGDPIHIQGSSGFRGMLSGPMSGYQPNITMHGTEELSIRPAGTGTGSNNASASEGSMQQLVEQMNELIYLTKSQLGVNEKMLRYQS